MPPNAFPFRSLKAFGPRFNLGNWCSPIWKRLPGACQEMVRDDALLDLRSALEDLGQPGIAPVALDGVQGGVARAAEHLQRLRGHPLGHLRGEELHHRRLLVAAALLVDL